ncbi:MAG TPA: hypothetical protein VF836_01360 [Gemmatimonadaceae bacterium]
MTASRIAVGALLVLLGALPLESCTNGDSARTTRDIDSSIAASEAMMLSFRDSVRGVSEEEKARRIRVALAVHAPDSLDACSTPLPAEEVTRQTTETFTLELPADFTLTLDGDVDRKAKHYGYGIYEFTGSDGSKVSVDGANNDESHSGWTGSISSECDVAIGSHRAHLDVANASIYAEDRIVHAHIYLSPQLALRFVAHAKSRQRQAQLLSATHSIRVRPAWGER